MKIIEMSTEGLECIARGGTGECFRLDNETILKLYYEGIPCERAFREKDCSRTALTIGVSTAISYELVRSGNRMGVIYEMLNGKTLSEIMREDPRSIPVVAGKYASLAKSLHSVSGDCVRFGRATDVIRREVPGLDYISENGKRNISSFLDRLDSYDRYVHGDFHPNNVMVCNGELMLIDLGGFSVGCPMFDIATTRFCLLDSPEARSGGISSFTGLSAEQHAEFWKAFSSSYFNAESFEETESSREDAALVRDIELLKRMRFEKIYSARYEKGSPYFDEIRSEAIRRWDT